MKKIYFVLVIFSLLACSKKLASQNSYLLKNENQEIAKESFKKADISFDMDFQNGKFSGTYKGRNFSGLYNINHTSSGFVKGFFYRVSLISLEKKAPASLEEERFFEHILKTTRISVQPDQLNAPSYIQLELDAPNSNKLIFIKFI